MMSNALQLERRILQAFSGPAPALSGRRRILVSAYTLSPNRGSEPAGAWNVVTRLAAFHDVHVLTSPLVEGDDYKTETEAYLLKHPIPGLTLHYVAPPTLAQRLMKPTGSLARLFYYFGYASWQRAVLREARRLHAERSFALIHQLNMTGYREPGYLWLLSAPFVWGPIGGAANMPWSFLKTMSLKEAAFYTIRNLANLVQRYTSVRCRRAARSARRIWYIGNDEKKLIEDVWRTKVAEPMLDSGTAPQPRPLPDYDGRRPLRLIWSGVHIGRKAMPILLHALAKIRRHCKVEVTILGDGPQTERWDTLAASLKVHNLLHWRGKLPREQAMAEMAKADALVFTSLTEGAPYVVLEAISMGLPVICHDACGMGVAVNSTCGIKIPLKDVDTSVEGFAAAIVRLAENPLDLARLCNGAAHQATELTWGAKVQQICRAYDRILSAAGHVDHPRNKTLQPASVRS